MDAVRRWFMSMPSDAVKWLLGVLAAELIVRAFDPEIAALASLIRDLIGM